MDNIIEEFESSDHIKYRITEINGVYQLTFYNPFMQIWQFAGLEESIQKCHELTEGDETRNNNTDNFLTEEEIKEILNS